MAVFECRAIRRCMAGVLIDFSVADITCAVCASAGDACFGEIADFDGRTAVVCAVDAVAVCIA